MSKKISISIEIEDENTCGFTIKSESCCMNCDCSPLDKAFLDYKRKLIKTIEALERIKNDYR
jgi:hypothetical protein